MMKDTNNTLIYKSARVTEIHDKGGDRTLSGTITRESVDEDGEVVLSDGLERRYNDKLGGVSILWNHDPNRPIGKLRTLTKRVGEWGASARLSNTKKGLEALELARDGILHFSIGFNRLEAGPPTDKERAKFPGAKFVTRKWQLMELTLTPVPAHSDARVIVKAMKSLQSRGLIGQSMVREFDPGLSINWNPDLVVPSVQGVDLSIPKW